MLQGLGGLTDTGIATCFGVAQKGAGWLLFCWLLLGCVFIIQQLSWNFGPLHASSIYWSLLCINCFLFCCWLSPNILPFICALSLSKHFLTWHLLRFVSYYRGFLLLCSRSSPCAGFPALADYFASYPWQPFKLPWMEVSSCLLLPRKQSQLFNTREVWRETKCKGWHFWRRKDLHFVSSSIQCNVSVQMQQWLILSAVKVFLMLLSRTTRNLARAICKWFFLLIPFKKVIKK